MTIDITEIGSLVRRMDTSATLKSFVVVVSILFVLTNLANIYEFVLQIWLIDTMIPKESHHLIAIVILLIVFAFGPLAFIFWDWVARQPWRHLSAIKGAITGAIGYAAIGGAVGFIGASILEEWDPTSMSVRLIISSVIGLLLATLLVWLTVKSKRIRQVLGWTLVLVLTLYPLAFFYVVFVATIEDPDSTVEDALKLIGLVIAVALVFWLIVRTIRHCIVLSGNRPRELFLGAIYRKSFWVRLAYLAGLPSSLWYVGAMRTPAFWAFLFARPLVYAGFLVLLSNTYERHDFATMVSAGIALIIAGHLLFYIGKRLAARYIWNPEKPHDPRDPVLFLRSFTDDQLRFKRSWWDIVGRWFDLWSYRRNADEALIDEIAQYGPVVALGMPGETTIPFGAMRYYSTHEDWQKIITGIAKKARAIVIGAGNTPGVLWEYELLSRESLLDRTLLLFPPADDDQSANLAALSAFIKATGINAGFDVLEDRHVVALLNTDAGPTLLTACEPMATAYIVAVRSHFQKCTVDQLADTLEL